MNSISRVFKIGRGPSSSHTIGVEAAVEVFQADNLEAVEYSVVLYNSLALTGKGHGTDDIIKQTFKKPVKIIFNYQLDDSLHANTLDISAHYLDGHTIVERFESVGGGDIKRGGILIGKDTVNVEYSHTNFTAIKEYCISKGIGLYQYIQEHEGQQLEPYLDRVWLQMSAAINNGLQKEGVLPGILKLNRKAKALHLSAIKEEAIEVREIKQLYAYAYAVSEENADGGTVVTAPTCGASGVLPSVLYYTQQKYSFTKENIIRALAVAGLVGNLIKTNASVSGAECGCQAEVGSACAMAAAALCELFGTNLDRLECAAEIALEHHLGLTCDPVGGQVQIPCIERNAVATARALNSYYMSELLYAQRRISFDQVVRTMYETGKDLPAPYRETSQGGLAKLYDQLVNNNKL